MTWSLSAPVNRLDTSALHASAATQTPADDDTSIAAVIGAVEAFLTSGAWGNDSASVSVTGWGDGISLSLSRVRQPEPQAAEQNVEATLGEGTAAPEAETPAASAPETAPEAPQAPDSTAATAETGAAPAETPVEAPAAAPEASATAAGGPETPPTGG
jgi:hypothetical protein